MGLVFPPSHKKARALRNKTNFFCLNNRFSYSLLGCLTSVSFVFSSTYASQDIEKTMNTALHELRELERQNVAKHAPDVVLDTLEPLKHPGGAQEVSASPLHTMVIRDPDAAQRRSSSSSSSETMTTFKPALSVRRPSAPLRPPPVRPVRPAPVIGQGQGPHRSSSSSSSGLGSPSITPTDRVFPKAPSPSPSTSSSSSDKQGNM